ncbi:MAG TPA: S41 family peptidase [Thermoanaerobaculia bacterium]|nr:S41 family peptidase [Thermoanaerobaculia bacterium]
MSKTIRRWSLTGLFVGLLCMMLVSVASGERPAMRGDQAIDQKVREYTELLEAASQWSPEEINEDKLVFASVRGMINTLDPHSYFLEPAGYHQMREKESGSYFGVGLLVTQRNGHVTVITPFEGSPAARLGIRAGDIIAEVDSVATDSLGYQESVRRLKGPKGTQVTIKIIRAGLEQPITMTVTRASIPTRSVVAVRMVGPETGYVRVTDFTGTTAREFDEAMATLGAGGMKKLVLDLRGNPGGSLDAALSLSDHFLQKGDLIVMTKGRTEGSHQQYLAEGKQARLDVPVVVMVDHGSASASEIVAGAIQDHDRGLVVGQTSWGKGLVQGVYNLQYGAGLALTTAKYYTPSGRNIQRDYSSLYDYFAGDIRDTHTQEPAAVYSTVTGRQVFGGGGITPDVVITPHALSRVTQLIEAHGILFDYGVDYVAKHPDADKSVEVTEAMVAELEQKASEKGIGTIEEIKAALAETADRNFIRRGMRAEIIAARYGYDASYGDRIAADEEIARAIELIPDAAKLAVAAAKARENKIAAGGAGPRLPERAARR